jgi:hypothetical protein
MNFGRQVKTCKHINYPKAGHLLDEQFVIGITKETNAAANKNATQKIKLLLNRVNS